MTEPLPPDKLEHLLPALRHVAELVQKNDALEREDWRLLLLASGLDEEWAISELERWATVLLAVRGVKNTTRREVAVRALMLRGVPEAPAKLAVEMVATPQPAKPTTLPIQVSQTAISFGELKPGQKAKATLKVSGGPGRVKVGSDLVKVKPEIFGPDETKLTVSVQGGLDGQILWDALSLESDTESVKVDIIARWSAPAVIVEPPAVEPEPTKSVLTLRGYFTLPHLIEQGMVRCFGRGVICNIIALDAERVVVIGQGVTGLLDLTREEALWEIDCPAWCGALTPDGTLLALGSHNDILLWDLKDGRFLRRMEGHGWTVTSVTFSPDGRFLASGSGDETVLLWEVSSGREIRRMEGHGDRVESVAFSPDGRFLASGDEDNTVRLWEVSSGREIRRMEGHTDTVYSVTFSPDGRFLASGSLDGTVRLWRVRE